MPTAFDFEPRYGITEILSVMRTLEIKDVNGEEVINAKQIFSDEDATKVRGTLLNRRGNSASSPTVSSPIKQTKSLFGRNPLVCQYLAIVGRNNVGRLGKRNAFPLLCIESESQKISKVQENEFPNYGYVLLNPNSKVVRIYPWDFVIITPKDNPLYPETRDNAVARYLVDGQDTYPLKQYPNLASQIAVILKSRGISKNTKRISKSVLSDQAARYGTVLLLTFLLKILSK